MGKILKFDLSEKGIKKINREIDEIVKNLNNNVNIEFIRLSLEWIKDRASKYLLESGHDLDLINAINASWSESFTKTSGKLINDYEKAAYIEFGVGAVGEENSYPKQFATELHWEYNLPTNSKNYMTGEWTFVVDNYDIIDIRKENITKQEIAGLGKTAITTMGNQGAMFMYNAIMDYANNISIPGELYKKAVTKFLGE